jgi:lipoprotein-anchoring transpeptidase ErfK/SrfK
MGVGLTAWLHWVPEPKEEPFEILERAQNRAQPAPVASASQPAGGVSPAPAVRSPSAGGQTPSNRVAVTTRARSGRAVVRTGEPGPEGRPVEDLFEAQLALARMGISPGSLDGVMGSRTRNALRAFQQRENLNPSGELDPATRQRLRLQEAPYRYDTVTEADLGRLLPMGSTWAAKSKQPRLDYETILELVSERNWSHPDHLRRLNPALDWARVSAGTRVLVPNVSRPPVADKAALVRIQLGTRTLQVFDQQLRLMAHYPCSIARSVDLRPVGVLRVEVLVPNPDYTFDPERFSQAQALEGVNTRLLLPPGPNNPVGTVWIGLDRPGYGIHGTPHPEAAGSAESLGCFRLANWNVEQLLELSWVGMPVYIEP